MKAEYICAILIVILGFAVYANSLHNQFLWDDELLIEENMYIRSWSNLAKLFREDIGRGGGLKSVFYRPVQLVTYMFDYSFWQLHVQGYHLSNIVFHILAALSLFWLINILYRHWLPALLAAVFFVTHPIHTEAVTYISGRADPLAGMFILLTFVFYLKSLDTKRASFYILMTVSYILALLSRENSLILPVLIVLYHLSFRKKISLKQFATIFIVALGYILFRFTLLSYIFTEGTIAYGGTTVLQRLPGFFAAITSYIRLLFIPFHLHMEYGRPLFKYLHPQTLLGISIFLILLIYALKQRRKSNLISFAIFWFLITLLPVSNLYPVNAYMAEHWLYLPSVGFFLILAQALTYLYQNKQKKTIAITLSVFLACFFSVLTIVQNTYWREPIRFYQKTINYAPDSAEVNNNLAKKYNEMDQPKKALPLLKRAIELNPEYAFAYYNMGISYFALHDYAQAISSYKKAIDFNPDFIKAYNNLGLTYRAGGQFKEAVSQFEKALKIDPNYIRIYNNLGVTYYDLGNLDQAISLYQRAIDIDPYYAEPYNNLAVIYRQLGRDDEAIALLEKVIQLKPDCAEAYHNIAFSYFYKRQYKTAIEYCDRAQALGIRINPEFLKALQPYRQ